MPFPWCCKREDNVVLPTVVKRAGSYEEVTITEDGKKEDTKPQPETTTETTTEEHHSGDGNHTTCTVTTTKVTEIHSSKQTDGEGEKDVKEAGDGKAETDEKEEKKEDAKES